MKIELVLALQRVHGLISDVNLSYEKFLYILNIKY